MKRFLRRRRSWERHLIYDRGALLSRRDVAIAEPKHLLTRWGDYSPLSRRNVASPEPKYSLARWGDCVDSMQSAALLLKAQKSFDMPFWPVMPGDPIESYLDVIALVKILKDDSWEYKPWWTSTKEAEPKHLLVRWDDCAEGQNLGPTHCFGAAEFRDLAGDLACENDDDLTGLVVRLDMFPQLLDAHEALGVVVREQASFCEIKCLQSEKICCLPFDQLDEATFPMGTLAGLRSKPQFNGMTVMLDRYNFSTQRLEAEVAQTGKKMRIKPCNVIDIRLFELDAAFKHNYGF